jgi:UDP-N-acetylmuramate dehydrogenase
MRSSLRPEGERSTFSKALSAVFGDRPRCDELLTGHTTLRLGGPADIWLAVESVAELVTAVTLAREYQMPVFMLGGGANLLISDRGIRGLVIENRANQVDFFPSPSTKKGEGKAKIMVRCGGR